jgi:uncharacterized protein
MHSRLAFVLAFAMECACSAAPPPPAPVHISAPADSQPAASTAPTASATPAASAAPAQEPCGDAAECVSLGEGAKAQAEDYKTPRPVAADKRAQALACFRRACKLDHARGCALAFEAYGMGEARSPACQVVFGQRACDLGDLQACVSVAGLLVWGRELAKDLARAASLLQRACDGGFMDGCDALGSMYVRGEGVATDVSRGVALRQRACDGGSSTACFSLGTTYRYSDKNIAKSPQRAARSYQKACELSMGNTDPARANILQLRYCTPYADFLVEGRWVRKNDALAARYYEPACSQGAFEACFSFAKLLAAGRGVAKDPVRAAELLESACGNAFGLGCAEGAAMFRTGNGVRRDLAKAAALEETGLGWSASGCAMQGQCDEVVRAYAAVTTTPHDPPTAMARIEKACALGVREGCRLAARKYASGAWVPKDTKRAAALEARARDLADPQRVTAMLERGCAANVSGDCYLLGYAYLNGDAAWKVEKNEARGRELLTKACVASGDDLGIECRLGGSSGMQEQPPGATTCEQAD